ncbi:lysylphosphatidylglycerol synthase transmembrane domain-containing protein [Terrimonas ferruginea]|uniref:lysylphosphatidylglycerol synthase transmembrane domain-containing protein n=1 Tax=Terrimonas ferruginea TaxID=249 RepID=UPI00041BD5DA|nr:lysylphosphatidylglycerol synthase transmembrane domain-containing protein [Terrimonas ferruginea]
MMQIKKEHKRKISLFVRFGLGPLLFAWLSWSIYNQVMRQPGLETSWQHIRESFASTKVWLMIGVLLLMIVNWGLEAVKWKLSVQQIQQVSLGKAFRAVLSGVSFSVSTPNRVGEYLGRVLYMDDGNRLKAISLTIMGSISQLMITLVAGLISLFFLRDTLSEHQLLTSFWLRMIGYGVGVGLLILTFFYFRLPWLIRWIDRLPAMRRFVWLIEALEHFNATLLWRLLSLSATRFMVFILQYYLLFRLFNVEISWPQALATISVMFLVMAVVPTIALFTDLGLKGEVSLKLVGLFSTNQLGIGLTTLSIWLINLVIPALAGSLLILSIKRIFNNRHERT